MSQDLFEHPRYILSEMITKISESLPLVDLRLYMWCSPGPTYRTCGAMRLKGRLLISAVQ